MAAGGGAGGMEARGDALCQEAERALKKFTLFSSTGKWQEAAELYGRAANSFKAAQCYEKAADTFSKIQGLQEKLGEEGEVTVAMRERVDALSKVDPKAASDLIRDGLAARLADAGRFRQVAQLYEDLAKTAEAESDSAQALEYYGEARNYWESDSSPSGVSRCRLKIAELSATAGNYAEAIQAFEQVADQCLEKPLTQFNAKKHLLDAGICMLAQGDFVAAEDAIETYTSKDYTFAESREGRLLAALVEACQQDDGNQEQAFVQHLFQFDQISKLSPWRTSLLLKARKHLKPAEEDLC